MYYTGMDPFTKEPVFIAKSLKDRKMQRALMQFFKPENYFEVRDALRQAGRHDLIGNGCDCLIPAQAPREAIERRRELAGEQFRGEYVHRMPGGQKKPDGAPGKGSRNPNAGGQPRDKQSRDKQSSSGLGSGGAGGSSSKPKPVGPRAQRKGPRKQSRFEPGLGYRPDRKTKRREGEA
jgi:hypothetical protein